jgi:hypothetical protein
MIASPDDRRPTSQARAAAAGNPPPPARRRVPGEANRARPYELAWIEVLGGFGVEGMVEALREPGA